MCKTHTLFAQQVAYNSLFGNEPISKNNSLGLATYGLVKVEGLVTTANSSAVTIKVSATAPEVDLIPDVALKSDKTYDLGGQQAYVGQNVAIYLQYRTKASTQNGNFLAASVEPDRFMKVYSSEVTPIDTGVLFVSHNGTKLADLTTRGNSKFKVEVEASADYFLNEVKSTEIAVATASAKVGVVVTFIDNDGNGKAEVVQAIEYTAAKVIALTTTGDGKVTLSTAVAGALAHPDKKDWTSKNVIGFENLEKDAIVYGYIDTENDTLKLFIPERIEGELKAYKGNDLTVDGSTYKPNASVTATNTAPATDNLAATVELFLDPNGYYVHNGVVEGAVKPYLYIKSAETSPYGTQRATAVFSDGTEKAINIYKIAGKTIGTVEGPTDYTIGGSYGFEVFTYVVNDDGTYNLTQDGTSSGTTYPEYYTTRTTLTDGQDIKVAVKKGVAKIDVTSTAVGGGTAIASIVDFRGDSNTIYVDVKNNTAYTGFANVPSIEIAEGGIAAAIKDGYAKVVFLVGSSSISDSATRIFVYDARSTAGTTTGTSSGSYTQISAIVDGVIKTDVLVTNDVWTAISNTATGTREGLYVVTSYTTIGGQQVIDGVDTPDTAASAAAVTGKGSNSFIVGGVAYTVNDATKYVAVDFDSVYTVPGTPTYFNSAAASEAVFENIIFGTGLDASNVIVHTVASSGTSADATTAKVVYIITDTNEFTYGLTWATGFTAFTGTLTVAGPSVTKNGTVDGSLSVEVTSNTPAVATVSTLTITAVTTGTATFTATVKDGSDVVATFTYTVAVTKS